MRARLTPIAVMCTLLIVPCVLAQTITQEVEGGFSDWSRPCTIYEVEILSSNAFVEIGQAATAETTPPASSQAADDLQKGRTLLRAGDLEEAFAAFQKSASAGNSDAMSHVGYMYAEGRGVKQDYDSALHWLREAAAAGNINAMTNLGILYANGRGVTPDYQQAREWFEKAAAAGNAKAMHDLGTLYDYGLGVTTNHEVARQWYEKAAATVANKKSPEQLAIPSPL
jgi:TPR repeat protein